jgi:hypothetical protein
MIAAIGGQLKTPKLELLPEASLFGPDGCLIPACYSPVRICREFPLFV